MSAEPDTIHLALPDLPCRIGVLPGENEAPQPVRAEVSVEVDLDPAMASGKLSDSVDYAPLHRALVRRICGSRWTLLEGLAGALMDEALRPEGVRAATISLTKVAPPLGDGAGPVTLRLRRKRQ